MENKKVLVVDDEKNIRMTLKKALEKENYQVSTAINGEDCLNKLQEEEYPVILLDKKLPGKDGIEVLRKIKEGDYGSRVIMITGYGNVDSAVETMKLGAVDFLQKPFKPEEIIALVNEVFGRIKLKQSEKEAETFTDFIRLAKTEINNRNLDEAVKMLKKAVAVDSEQPEPFNLLGVIYEVKGQQAEAMKMYRAALSLDPSYTPANENLQRAGEGDIREQGQLNRANLGEEEGEQ